MGEPAALAARATLVVMGHEKPIRIPLPPDEAVSDFLKVRPTADMPRPGARGAKTKKRKTAKK